MTRELKVSSSPHIRSGTSTERIMVTVVLSMLPCVAAGTYFFGLRAILVCLFSVMGALLTELAVCAVSGSLHQVRNFSAVVTGLLLGLTLPSELPLWQAFFGGAMATGIFKHAFGGIGKNPVNPAIASRVFMLLSFGELASPSFPKSVDVTSSATPLEFLKEGESFGLAELFFGFRGGCIGETCIAAILVSFVILLLSGVIRHYTVTSFVGTVFLTSLFYENGDILLALEWTLAGSVLFGAVFMATDYVTSPTTSMGQVFFGILCGFLTCVIRLYGKYPEGVSFAILLAGFAVPLICRLTEKKVLGVKKR